MVLVLRFYPVMGKILVTELNAALERISGETCSKFIGRSYVNFDDVVRIDDLWMGLQQLARDHCERGYHDDLCDWLQYA
jgi:hypothetical protein